MGRFDKQIATALRLIEKNGQAVIWQKEQKKSDTLEPWKQVDANPVKKPVVICFLPSKRVGKQTKHYLADAPQIEQSSVTGLMGAVDFTPENIDTVLRNGKELRILSIDELAPNGQTVLYTIEFE